MINRFIHRILLFALILSSACLNVHADELCTNGTLLFREDFGGNNPNDPVAGVNPAPGMTSNYMQIFDTATCIAHYPCTGMGSGRYLLTKIGYRNASSYTYSHWFIMDDHTYPNDYTRGYLLEVDGRTDNATLFETVIDGLCEGSKLAFSAYVTNVTTSYSYDHGNNGDPQLSFVLVDPGTGAQLVAPYKTGPIPVDRSYQNVSGEWRHSAHWKLVGMNFTVPAGKTAIKLQIKNACTAGGGNDFAIDDIEIRLCAPPITIEGEAEVCENEAKIFSADFTNDGTFPEPLAYKWWHSVDSLTWTEVSETSSALTIPSVQKSDSGWYKVAVSGASTIGCANCRAMSAPFRLKVKECAPEPKPNLCTGGILLFREDFGGNNPNDPEVITDAATARTTVPGMSTAYSVCTSRTSGMGSGKFLVTKQGYMNGVGSSQWHLQDDHTYPGDYTRGYLLEIDGKAGSAAFYQTTIDHLCEGIELTFSAYVANVMTWGMYMGRPGVYAYPRLKFVLTDPSSNAELATHDTGNIPFDSAFIGDNLCWKQSVKWQLVGMNFTVPVGVESIRLSIYNNVTNSNGNDFALDDIEIRLCMTPDTIRKDTVVCDTISQIQWRDKTFEIADTLRDTLRSSCGFDSIYYIMKVGTKVCCPKLRTIFKDTIVCDTLMPYRWCGTLFKKSDTHEVLYRNRRGCDSLLQVLTLRTTHCPYPTVTLSSDTTICDTIRQIKWREKNYSVVTELRDTLFDAYGADSVYFILNISTRACCPEIITLTHDTLVCDTLLPFTWTIDNQTFVFNQVGTQQREMSHPQWIQCIGTNYIVSLDTFRCERLEPPVQPDPEPEPIPDPDLGLCRSGKLLFREDFGGNDPNDPEVSCSRVEGVLYKNACQTPDNISRGACLVTKRGRGYYERQWLDRADHTYPNDFSRGYYLVVNGDNNRLFYSIDLPGGESGSDFSFSAYVISLHESIYGDEERSGIYRCPSILFDFLNGSTSERITAYYTDDIEFEKSISEFKRWHLIGTKFTLPKDIPYIVLNVYAPFIGRIGNDFGLDDIEFRLCRKTEEQRIDTTVCDTLLPLVWLGRQWTDEGTLTDTLRYTDGGDSVYVQMSLHTQNCCPVSQTVLLDTLVCDTLLPFVWQGIIWQNAGIQEISIPHPKWTQCVDTNYIIHLDTVHCERLYPLIVNKYNWQLLLDNIALQKLFPNQTARSFQWYNNEEPVSGATEDNYSEQNELHGRFQLRVELDNGHTIWSNILEILNEKAEMPIEIKVYNWQNLYLYRYEQGDKVWTEKKLIP